MLIGVALLCNALTNGAGLSVTATLRTAFGSVRSTSIFAEFTTSLDELEMATEQSFVTSDDVTKCAYLMLQDTGFRANPTTQPDLGTLCSADALGALQLAGPVRGIQQNVTVTTAPPSSIMTITYASANTHAAQVGSQAFANAYIYERVLQASTQLDALRAPLLKQQDALSNKISSFNEKIAKKNDAITKAENNGDPTLALTLQLADLTSQRDAIQRTLDGNATSLLQLDPSKLNQPQLLVSKINCRESFSVKDVIFNNIVREYAMETS